MAVTSGLELDIGDPAALAENPLDSIGAGRLGVDAQERLGAGEADQQPGAIVGYELLAVDRETVDLRVDARNLAAVDLTRLRGGDAMQDGITLFRREVHVHPDCGASAYLYQ